MSLGSSRGMETKEIEAPIFTRNSFTSKGMEKVGTTRKEWVRRLPLKIQLSGRFW